jgi:hypothetical protein
MTRMKAFVLFVAVAFALSGCSLFFEFNAFAGLSTPPKPTLADYQGSGGLAKLQQDLTSPAVIAALKNDPVTTKAIEDYLLTQIGAGALTTDAQKQAAILYGDVNLKTTEGEALVNNVVSTLVGGIPSSTGIQALLKSILPPAALANPAVFSSMVGALLASNTQYLALGASLDVDSDGDVEAGEGVPPGTNMGDVAQKAAVAWTMKVLYDDVDANIAGVQTQDQIIAEMYLQATGDPTANTTVTNMTLTNPYSPVNANLKNLFDCAGLPMPT